MVSSEIEQMFQLHPHFISLLLLSIFKSSLNSLYLLKVQVLSKGYFEVSGSV